MEKLTMKERKELHRYNCQHEIKYPPLDENESKKDSEAVFLLLGVASAMCFALIIALFLI